MGQERLVGAVGHRPARRLAAAAQPDPAGLQQHVEGSLRRGHAADVLDLGARHRLVIGDDGQRLDGGARQLPRHRRFVGQQPGEIARGAQRPFAGNANQVHAARLVLFLQLGEQRAHVDTGRQALPQNFFVERALGGEQQRLENAQFLRALGWLALVSDDHTHLRHIPHCVGLPLTHSPFRRPRRRLPSSAACARKAARKPRAGSARGGLRAPVRASPQSSMP